jgi:guanylate kinase
MAKGKLIIISAPSGCGKSTIIGEITKNEKLNLAFSVSATTRAPRGEEVHGVNYYFLSEDEFRQAIANDELVEYEEVYPGRFYGTLKSEITRICESGKNVILDIDVKGGINVKKQYGSEAVSIFIMPPSVDVLRERLESRATDSEEAIAERVGKAEYEISFAQEFDCQVVNDILDVAVKETEQIITDFVL